MHKKSLLLYGSLMILGIVAPVWAEEGTDKDLAGSWVATSMESNGKKAPEDAVKRVRFRFEGEKLFLRGNFESDQEDVCSFSTDTTKNPKYLNFTPAKEEKPILAIYKVTAKTLTICLEHSGSDKGRPTVFSITPDSDLVLIVFSRSKGEDSIEATTNASPGHNDQNMEEVTRKDLKAIAACLEEYKKIAGAYPTTEHGLAALVELPVKPPVPVDWKRLASDVPLDHWDREYRYASKGSTVWLWSLGPNPNSDDDDIYHQDKRPQKGEQPDPAQPVTKPADKAPVKDQPSTPTSKDAPR